MTKTPGEDRGYQPNFFTLSSRVRDPARRQRKAEKIAYALTERSAQAMDQLTCLDVGCSSGLMTAALAPLFQETVGLDFDTVALAAVEEQQRSAVRFLRGDAMRMPFGDQSVDVVLCAQVYEHVLDAERLFAEIYRVLRPGGIVFFSGPNWLFPVEPHYFLPFLHWLPPHWAARYLTLIGLGNDYYERSLPIWSLRRMLNRFEIEDLTYDLMQAGFLVASPGLRQMLVALPGSFWSAVAPVLPNFNWLLRKPRCE